MGWRGRRARPSTGPHAHRTHTRAVGRQRVGPRAAMGSREGALGARAIESGPHRRLEVWMARRQIVRRHHVHVGRPRVRARRGVPVQVPNAGPEVR